MATAAIPLEDLARSLDSLALTSGTPNFQDAMEVVWFYFDPKKDTRMFDRMSLLVTLIRGSLDGNVKPPLDLAALYQDRYQAQRRTA